jgi:hypothetical protein
MTKVGKIFPWVILALVAVIFMRGTSGFRFRFRERLARRQERLAPNGTIYNKFMRSNFPGGDLTSFPQLIRADCAKKCEENTDCIGFVREAVGPGVPGMCYLKKSWAPRVRTRKYNTYSLA